MRKSITQEYDYGCGVACFAFATHMSYQQAAKHLGYTQANSPRFYVKDLIKALNSAGEQYASRHIKAGARAGYPEGSIVLIRRAKLYPAGHYLIRHNCAWMDPWINLPYNKDVGQAQSGFRKRLPGQAMYIISPV